MIGLKVEGLNRLPRSLRAKTKLVEKEVATAMAISADRVVASMERYAPERSGALVNSIGWVWGDDAPKGSFSVSSITGRGRFRDLRITIFAGDEDAYYARWQEFGTARSPSNPYFFVSWRLERRGTRSRMTRAVKRALK